MSKLSKLILITILTAFTLSFFLFRDQIPKVFSLFLSSDSINKSVSSIGTPKSTDGRTNILILGIDKREKNNSMLTDTIMVVSIDTETGEAVVISIPRDLWINEIGSKINAVYYWAHKNNDDGKSPVDAVAKVVGNIVGMPIHYYAVVNFDAFRDAIDAIGGIDIEVKNTFDDYLYPIEGKENAPESERYEHLHFDAGMQHMDGATALKYSRSRHSENVLESGDFARARRQQAVLTALKDKLTSTDTVFDLTKLINLYNTYKNNVETNIGPNEIGLFYNSYKNLSKGSITSVVLSNEKRDENILGSGMLYAPSKDDRDLLYHGAYVLIPKDGSFNEIHAMLRELLFDKLN